MGWIHAANWILRPLRFSLWEIVLLYLEVYFYSRQPQVWAASAQVVVFSFLLIPKHTWVPILVTIATLYGYLYMFAKCARGPMSTPVM